MNASDNGCSTQAPGIAHDAADATAIRDRHDPRDLAGIVDVLTDVNRRAAELVKGRL